MSLAFVAPGRVISAESYGFADIETARAMTPATPMPIGSISKVIIGAAAAVEADAGRLDLDAPISTYWPDAPDALSGVTFRHLATHTGGIRDSEAGYEGQAYAQGTLTHPVPLGRFLTDYLTPSGAHYAAGTVGVTEPGAVHAYSNVGAALAAHILAETTGTPFALLTQGHVFDPLVLTATWDATQAPGRATLYEPGEGGALAPLEPYALATWPDGGLNATLNDLARLLATYMGGGRFEDARLLPADAIQTQTTLATRGKPGMDDTMADGLFWQAERVSLPTLSLDVVGHSGGDPGVLTMMYQVIGTKRGFVVMVNGMRDDPVTLFHALRLLTAIKRAAVLADEP